MSGERMMKEVIESGWKETSKGKVRKVQFGKGKLNKTCYGIKSMTKRTED